MGPPSNPLIKQLAASEVAFGCLAGAESIRSHAEDNKDKHMKNNNTAQLTAASSSPAPWSGAYDDKECQRPGGLLMGALLACAAERGQTQADMARDIGYAPGYFAQLRTGNRETKSISTEFAQACAGYLGISTVRTMLMAGKISVADFYESPEACRRDLSRAMSFIVQDGEWGHLITQELREASEASQSAVVRLYEKATGNVLLRRASERAAPAVLHDRELCPTTEMLID